MAKSWVGLAIAPSGWVPERWTLAATFQADGHYEAKTYDPAWAPAFYYGSDLPCSLKQWRMRAVGAGGIEGQIDVTFQYPSEACYLPTWQGVLRRLEFDRTSHRVRFEFTRDDGYGPIAYDLWETCQPSQWEAGQPTP
jgi:hypothetical protein